MTLTLKRKQPGNPQGLEPEGRTDDARNLLKEARNLLQRDKIEEADKLCVQAAHAKFRNWGLFEDSPDKLRVDIQKARARRDRDEAARLMIEANQLFRMGHFPEAKMKAQRAQEKHGPYTIWDLGTRPQHLLEAIHRSTISCQF